MQNSTPTADILHPTGHANGHGAHHEHEKAHKIHAKHQESTKGAYQVRWRVHKHPDSNFFALVFPGE